MDKIALSLLIAIFLSGIGVLGDSFLKMAGRGPRYIDWKWFIIGFTVYASTAFGWFYCMKNIKLGTLGVFYAVATVVFSVLVGVFYFHESLNAYEIIGVSLAFISLLLIGRFA